MPEGMTYKNGRFNTKQVPMTSETGIRGMIVNTTLDNVFSRLSARLGRRLLHGVHGLLHPPPPPECFEWTAGGTEKADAEICVAAMMAGKLLEAGKGRHNRPLSAGHTDGLRKV